MRHRPAHLHLLLAGLSMSAASVSAPLDGLWGGERLQLTLDAGVGRLAGDCVSGSFNGPLTLAPDGSFRASGSFEQLPPGPDRADAGKPPAGPADYAGTVSADGLSMRLSIQTSGAAAPQVFTLRKGVKLKLIRCL
jgi:hypothetical protein